MSELRTMLTEEQLLRLADDPAWKNPLRPMGFPLGATPHQFTGHFHQVMGLPAPEAPIVPPVSMRIRRLRLILEEFLELCEANGCSLDFTPKGDYANLKPEDCFSISHIEGSRYDVVECADALGDLNVVVAGTGVEYGIPMHFIDYEVYCSNLSKLDEAGTPIVNHCQRCGPDEDNVYYSSCACDSPEFWLDPKAPIGKILKSDRYVAPNIPRVLLAYENKEL